MTALRTLAAAWLTLAAPLMTSLAVPALAQQSTVDAALVEPDDRLETRLAALEAAGGSNRDRLSLYVRYGATEPGLALARQTLAADPSDPVAFKGMVQLQASRISAASLFGKSAVAEELIEACDQEVIRAPGNIAARRCVAQFHLEAPSIVGGDPKKAESAIQALESLDRSQFLQMRALQAAAAEDDEQASALQTEALPLITVADEAAAIAVRRTNLKDAAGAWAALDRARQLDPAEPMVLYQTGRTAALTGQRLEEGRDALLQFLAGTAWIDGTDFRPGAHWRLGMVLEKLGQPDQAVAAYTRTLALDSGHKEAKKALKALQRRS